MHFLKVYSAICAFVVSTFICTTLAKCVWNKTCPCGPSGINLQFCLGAAPTTADPCATWENCATCHPDLNKCLTCPKGRSGFKCSLTDGECDLQFDGNATHNCTTTPEGKVCDIECYSPFQSSSQRHFCKPGNGWTPPLPACVPGRRHRRRRVTNDNTDVDQIECRDPGQVENANRFVPGNIRRSRLDHFNEKTVMMFYCNDGFVLRGASLITCLSSGSWSAPTPSCIPRIEISTSRPAECSDPGQVENGNRLLFIGIRSGAQTFLPGESVVFSCYPGYTMINGTSDLFCLDSGTWSATLPSCQRNETFTFDNDNENTDFDPDEDEGRVWCVSPGPIDHGKWKIVFSPIQLELEEDEEEFPDRTRLFYSCDEGFSLEGFEMLHCEQNGHWNNNSPKCIRDCGRSLPQTRKKIQFGVRSIPGEWPFVVAVVKLTSTIPLSCGGSLIDSTTVLTAAHCLVDSEVEEPSNIRLYFGKFYRDFDKDDTNVEIREPYKFIIHPQYNSKTLENDVALIQFDLPIKMTERIQPICLPTRDTSQANLKPKKIGYVLGWGKNEDNLPSDELMMANLPVVSSSECRKAYRRMNLTTPITNNMFCAGHTEGRTSACPGDSGGPFVFFNTKTDRFTIEGIVSYGVTDRCGAAQSYTIFTLVSNYADWINRSLK